MKKTKKFLIGALVTLMFCAGFAACGSNLDSDDVLSSSHEHTYAEKITKEAACVETGEKTYTCECGDSYTEEISAIGHNYENYVCTYCGGDTFSKGLKYVLSDNKKYYIVEDIGDCQDDDLIIPPTYNGLPVASIGDMAFYNCDNLESVVIPDGVTSIGVNAFFSCGRLTKIIIPDSVISIEVKAFGECNRLTSMEVSENNSRYQSIDGNLYTEDGKTLIQYAVGKTDTLFVIPDEVTSIGEWAFYGCFSLTNVEISNGVTSIGESAFDCCKGLMSVEIPDSVISIGKKAFFECDSLANVVIGDNIKSISSYAFYDCNSLASVVIGDSVTSIGIYAFYNCNNLMSVYYTGDIAGWCAIDFANNTSNPLIYEVDLYIDDVLLAESLVVPDGVTNIGWGAFYGCTSLTSLKIGDSVTSIGDSAFYGCSSLMSVEIGGSVTSIGDFAFYGCNNLANFEIPNGLTSIGEGAFLDCYSLTNVVFPDSLRSIGVKAFFGCNGLINIIIPDSVISIASDAFANCDSLISIEVSENNIVYQSIDGNLYTKCGTTLIQYIGGKFTTSFKIFDGVISIGYRAFEGCDKLTNIEISESVTNIGVEAFKNCVNLTSITFNGTTEQWNAIEKGSSWNYAIPATEVVCSDGTVTIER